MYIYYQSIYLYEEKEGERKKKYEVFRSKSNGVMDTKG
jgi:hypothetical protein